GGNAVEVYRINPDGTLKSVFVLPDTDTTYLGIVITLQVIHMKTASYLFVGGLEETPGLSSFRISEEGKLTHVQSMADSEELFTDGIIGMSTHQIDGKTFLFTGGFQDNGLSSFRVYEDGHFENVCNIGDDRNLYLNGTYPVISASRSGWEYVIVGHRHHIYYKPTPWVKDRQTYYYHGDAVSVFRVDEVGKLIPRSIFLGNSENMIQGQTRLHKLPLDKDHDLIAVATRDDQSLQLCVLNNTGRLIDAGKLNTGFPIYYGLSGQKMGDHLFLFAGSVNGKELVSYRLDPT
ncbi:MAG: stress protein, partial [Bacteroidota bacterium]